MITAIFVIVRRRPPSVIRSHLYQVQPRGQPADVSLAGLQIDQIDAATYQHVQDE